MKLQFLGGADEVGASCTLLEISGHRLLVDCGIRMKEEAGNNLPDLSRLQDGGIEAVILTHAHIDHSGALPVVYQLYDIPLYLTPPTLSLISIMLLDALNIMQIGLCQEGEIPLYSLSEVEKVIAAARPIPFCQTITLFDGEVRLTFYPSGHILGAACVALESRDGTVLISGDISVGAQLTVSGMEAPKIKPDVLVLESTYGGRIHSARKLEEQRLVSQVARIIENRGAVLVPAFAVGRAQEVILILARAMEKGALQKVPIVVDGLVRSICKVYSSYPQLVPPWLKKRIAKYGNPFFHDKTTVVPVWDPKKRKEYAAMRPVIIVSSSGMLSGGPSQMYALLMAGDPNSFIAITGYQDEESPGRKLQEQAKAGGGELQLGDALIDLKCGLGTYSLSAHADTTQLVGVMKTAGARQVALVHGDLNAREELKRAAKRAGIKKIILPGTEDEIAVRKRRGRRVWKDTYRPETYTGKIRASDLPKLAEKLLARDGRNCSYTVQELLISGEFPAQMISASEIKRMDKLLVAGESPFKQDGRRKFLYRVRTDQQGEVVQTAKISRWEQNQARRKIDRMFPKTAGLYRRSFRPEQNILELYFEFPKVAGKRYAEKIERLEKKSGWQVLIHPQTHQEALKKKALDVLPNDWPPKKTPSLYIDREQVVIQVDLVDLPLEKVEKTVTEFWEATGFKLKLTPAVLARPDNLKNGPMEINLVYTTIKKSFRDKPHQPLKIGLKDNGKEIYIELAFISPIVAERYQDIIKGLEKETGFVLKIKPHPDQHRIKELAKSMIPDFLQMRKQPAFYQEKALVSVKLDAIPNKELAASLRKQFAEQTGYQLSLEIPE